MRNICSSVVEERPKYAGRLALFVFGVGAAAVLACQPDRVSSPPPPAAAVQDLAPETSADLLADTVAEKKAGRARAREFARRFPEATELNVCYAVSVDPSKPIASRYTFERIELPDSVQLDHLEKATLQRTPFFMRWDADKHINFRANCMISSSQTAFERVEAFLARPGDTKAPTVGKIRPHELRGRSDDTVYTGVALPEQETESTPALEVEAGDGDPDYSSLAAHFFTDLTTAARKAPAASPAAGAAFFCSIGDLNGFFEVFTCGIFQCYLETVAAPAPERGPRWTPNTDVSYKCYTDECPDENGGYGLDVWAEEGGGMTYGIEYYDLYWEFCTWEDVECESEEEDPGSGGAGGGGSGGPNPPVTCSDGYIDNGSGTCVTLTMELCEYWFVSFWGIDLKSSGCLKELTHNDSALVNAAIAMWKSTL